MSESDFEKIRPAELEIGARREPAAEGTSAAAGSTPSGPDNEQAWRRRQNVLLWGIFLALLILAIGVVFVLPRYVSPPDFSVASAVPEAPRATSPAPARGEQLSPYEEAQRQARREAAQEVLAELLALQDQLEIMAAREWAGEALEQAVTEARAGDDAYREQDFQAAAEHYRAGLEQMQAIEARSGAVFEELLRQGHQALNTGDAEAATQAFSLALDIDGGSQEADRGLARAQVLPRLLALLDEGRELEAGQALEDARERYREATRLDNEHAQAADALARVDEAIIARDFGKLMSRGYAALQATTPDQAREAFNQALKLRPGAEEALAALEQAEDMITSQAIAVHLEQAAAAEAAEQWQEALSQYEQALAIDTNVVNAQNGLERARSRLNLDKFLERLIAEPLRLADDGVYQQSRELVARARDLPAPGPRLANQLASAEELLRKARETVPVSLRSDGLTRVTVYRVGELGQFSEQTLQLTPGTYTAVGVREGYRDVRREFTVDFDGQAPQVSIACEERIL